jgi:hypothetical protein
VPSSEESNEFLKDSLIIELKDVIPAAIVVFDLCLLLDDYGGKRLCSKFHSIKEMQFKMYV